MNGRQHESTAIAFLLSLWRTTRTAVYMVVGRQFRHGYLAAWGEGSVENRLGNYSRFAFRENETKTSNILHNKIKIINLFWL